MLSFIRTSVWPHASKGRTNTLRAVLYKEPFRARTPGSICHKDTAWVSQVMPVQVCNRRETRSFWWRVASQSVIHALLFVCLLLYVEFQVVHSVNQMFQRAGEAEVSPAEHAQLLHLAEMRMAQSQPLPDSALSV